MLRLILFLFFAWITLFSYFSTNLGPITAYNYQRIAFCLIVLIYDISRTIVNVTISKRERERERERETDRQRERERERETETKTNRERDIYRDRQKGCGGYIPRFR